MGPEKGFPGVKTLFLQNRAELCGCLVLALVFCTTWALGETIGPVFLVLGILASVGAGFVSILLIERYGPPWLQSEGD